MPLTTMTTAELLVLYVSSSQAAARGDQEASRVKEMVQSILDGRID